MSSTYITLGKFAIDEVLPFTGDNCRPKFFVGTDGEKYRVRMNSSRYQVFKQGVACVSCGLVGTSFLLQRDAACFRAHFNLYGLSKTGKHVLFTQDHRIPASKGGPSTLDNLQTMCYPCNKKKADREP